MQICKNMPLDRQLSWISAMLTWVMLLQHLICLLIRLETIGSSRMKDSVRPRVQRASGQNVWPWPFQGLLYNINCWGNNEPQTDHTKKTSSSWGSFPPSAPKHQPKVAAPKDLRHRVGDAEEEEVGWSGRWEKKSKALFFQIEKAEKCGYGCWRGLGSRAFCAENVLSPIEQCCMVRAILTAKIACSWTKVSMVTPFSNQSAA